MYLLSFLILLILKYFTVEGVRKAIKACPSYTVITSSLKAKPTVTAICSTSASVNP